VEEEFEDTTGVVRIRKSKQKTTQWPKEKGQKNKQRFTKHTHKTKDRVTRTPLKIGVELKWSRRTSSSCSTSGTCRVNLVTSPLYNVQYIYYEKKVFPPRKVKFQLM
jgi:hypothetical protein